LKIDEMSKSDLTWTPNLRQIILDLLLQIPEGMISTYKGLALAIGDESAARSVGTVLANNPWPDKYPCWKVVHSSGKVGKYSGENGKQGKIMRMQAEGIQVLGDRVANFDQVRFSDFQVEAPLAQLSKRQREIHNQVEQGPLEEYPSQVGGVDLSYAEGKVTASYVELHLDSLEVEYENSLERESVQFPYIPGYLAFREMPLLIELLSEIRQQRKLAELIFVDGNGLLHPRNAGLATHLGVALDHPAVGIAKKLLCGKVNVDGMVLGDRRPVMVDGRCLGFAVKTYSRANPIYVSVGPRVSLDQAVDIALETAEYKLPEPVRSAHKLAKRLATS